ncbi:unnamed protein product [Vitrella brassicaformis CCMP3155]|uniref:sulfite oxidase n=2 Tax=Vitrella brassicaformis TaxID=1169539 RepID=A0A0G4FJ46_VITBC|nr:unnamed protein product [Vitrella brassicaformis CCMP3155]|mmetsp:Transcript_50615/g.126951  ORF Transcript_50615/g.126951 Transcript_50615/m.126951 type:complete len:673 (+) Transcript_50615:44-2062(+)|eukprot:CEM13750.1 unnamed protein product [Vitrella brassicaformis CCMP3155]
MQLGRRASALARKELGRRFFASRPSLASQHPTGDSRGDQRRLFELAAGAGALLFAVGGAAAYARRSRPSRCEEAVAAGTKTDNLQLAHRFHDSTSPSHVSLPIPTLPPPPSSTVTLVTADGPPSPKAGEWIKGLPEYSKEQVAEHKTADKRIWVSYKDGVYDITGFIDKHPGGARRISLAAGGSIEPFWAMYQQHNKPEILEMLEEYRIGNYLRPADSPSVDDLRTTADDPYRNEPSRHPALNVVSERPFNAETPVALLADHFITPNEVFFVRNHLPVPTLEGDGYEVQISGLGFQGPLNLSLNDLKTKFQKHTVTTTIQCAGNRRHAFNQVKSVKGLNWGNGAIGTAEWSGASLRDVLSYCGVYDERARLLKAKHVQFEGWDEDLSGCPYGASIPLEKAISEHGDVILAYEMNGQPLPRDHGFPLRVIIPGVVGARQVKWLRKVIISEEESQSFWQQNDYRVFSPSVDWDRVDWRKAPAIQEYPVQSAVCDPMDGSIVPPDQEDVTVKGYAWSGGGRAIIRVDVTIDGGVTWHEANLRCRDKRCHLRTDSSYEDASKAASEPAGDEEDDDEDDEVLAQEASDFTTRPVDKAWAWALWEAHIPVPQELRGRELEICCRAVDASYNVQPESVSAIWNLRGCLCNAWDRVKVKCTTATAEAVAAAAAVGVPAAA